MDKKAYFKLSYGLFVVGTESGGRTNGCIINTAAQATSEPGRMVATMLKSNLTTELILAKGSMTISVIGMDCPMETIKHFGLTSGRETEKFAPDCTRDQLGNPYIEEGMTARFSCKVAETLDLGTHYLFICEVTDCLMLSAREPMTYADYRALKSGKKPAAQPEQAAAAASRAKPVRRWVCSVCHYVYDGDTPFEELPDDWKCPICKRGKEVFVLED